MRTRERKLNIRRQSKDRVPRENLWFYNGDSILSSTPIPEKRSYQRGSLRTINENYDPFLEKTSEKNQLRNECLFVVDWQM